MKTTIGHLYLLASLLGLVLMPVAQAMAQSYTFGPVVQEPPPANVSYNASTGLFQYTDADNTSDALAYIPLSGSAASLITTSSGWTASISASLAATSLIVSGGVDEPHKEVLLGILAKDAHNKPIHFVIVLYQMNNTAGGDSSDFPPGFYGSAVRVAGGTYLPTALGNAFAYSNDVWTGGDCAILPLAAGTNASPADELVGATNGILKVTYDASTKILTSYFNQEAVAEQSIAGWTHLSLVVGGGDKEVGATNGSITANNFMQVSFGSLQVMIEPSGAVSNGAQWQLDGGSWQKSGTTVSNLSPTNHTLSFHTVSGWTTPANQTVSIKANKVTKETGAYVFSSQGNYNGLFAQSEANLETMGMLSGLAVTASGTYSGKLLTAGTTNSISGTFNVSGQASNHIARSASRGGPLALGMTLNWTDSPPNITGTVSGTNGGTWTAILTAELASKATNSADYTAQVLPPTAPPGYGYLLITNHAGAVTLSGALADGTSFSQQVPLSGTGDLPVYGSLYGNTGLLTGWLRLESGSPAGSLTWIKEASRSSTLYTNGFTNLVSVTGSVWTNPPAHVAAIDLPSGQLFIHGGDLPSSLLFNVSISNNNTLIKLADSPTNTLTGTNNPKNGLLTITFGNGDGKATTKATGAALQSTTNAAGFFLGKTNAGSFLLLPSP